MERLQVDSLVWLFLDDRRGKGTANFQPTMVARAIKSYADRTTNENNILPYRAFRALKFKSHKLFLAIL